MKLKFLFFFLIIFGLVKANNPTASWIDTFKSSDNQTITKTLTDSKGNVYVVGTFRTSLTFGTYTIFSSGIQNIYIVKYDSSGKLLWAKNDCTGEGGLNLNSAAIDKSDYILLCGSFYSNQKSFGNITLSNLNESGPTKYFVVKYNSDGKVLWAKGNSNTLLYTSASSVAADNSGNIYLSGTFQDNTISFGSFVLTKSTTEHNNVDVFLVKLDESGNVIWAKGIYGEYNEAVNDMAVDLSDNIYLTGFFSGATVTFGNVKLTNNSRGGEDIFIAKSSSTGDFIWAKAVGGPYRDISNSVTVDRYGNVCIGGYFLSPELKFENIILKNPNKQDYGYWKNFVAEYNTNGQVLWAKGSTADTQGDLTLSVSADRYGFVYSTGYFTSETLTLDTIKLTKSVQTGQDMYFCKYTTNGKVIWAQNVGCSYSSGLSVSVDNSGNLFMAGLYGVSDPAIYHPFNYFKLTNNGGFVAKILGDTSRLSIDHFYCKEDLSTTLTAPANNYYYTWIDSENKIISNAQTIVINNPIDSTIYTCKFKNINDSILIWKYLLLRNNMISDFSSSLSDCATNTVQFTNHSTTNRGSLTYLWDFGDGTTSTEINTLHKYSTVGIHQVSLSASTSPASCSNSISKSIAIYPKPTIKIDGDSTICHGIPVTLKAQGAASYKWSTGSIAESIQVATTQKVWLLGYSASGCVSDTTFLKVTDRTPVVSINGNATYCPGLSVTLKARGASSYKWSTGSIADSINVSSPGTIWLVGYTSTCVSDTVKYSITEEPDFNVSINGNMYICSGESTTLTAAGASSYRWSTGEKTNSITLTKAGDYSVIGSNARGCERELSFNVTEEKLPALDFTVSSTTIDSRHNKLTCKTTVTAGIEYSWNMGDGSTEHGSETEHTYNIPNSVNTYTITLTATNMWGCSNSLSKEIDVILFIPNVFSPNGDGVNDVFMPDVNLEIQDRNGITLFKGTSGWDGNYHLKKMPDDTYYYVVTYKDKNGQTQMQKGYVILKR